MARKLNEQQITTMRKMLDAGIDGREIASKVGCSVRAVCARRQRWKLGLDRHTEYRSKPCKCHLICMDHSFRQDLVCDCGKTWGQHQHSPTQCAMQMKVRHSQNKEFCNNGHDLEDPANVYVYPSGKRKYCRACRNTQDRAGVKKRDKPRTHCQRGHSLTEDNIYLAPGNDTRQCRVCRKRRGDARQAARKAKRGKG